MIPNIGFFFLLFYLYDEIPASNVKLYLLKKLDIHSSRIGQCDTPEYLAANVISQSLGSDIISPDFLACKDFGKENHVSQKVVTTESLVCGPKNK